VKGSPSEQPEIPVHRVDVISCVPAPREARDSAITLRNLVTHASGLQNFPENQTEPEWARR
jgi:CubicO group peptidase (beta-lactamase class C family)